MSFEREKRHFTGEKERLLALADRRSRRVHYMLCNKDGDYSIEDIILVRFEAEIIRIIAGCMGEIVDRINAKIEARMRYKERSYTGDLWEEYYDSLQNPSKICTDGESGDRWILEALQEQAFKEILWLKQGYDPRDDKREEERMQSDERPCDRISHLKWSENATREDIVNGESEDYRNLLKAVRCERTMSEV